MPGFVNHDIGAYISGGPMRAPGDGSGTDVQGNVLNLVQWKTRFNSIAALFCFDGTLADGVEVTATIKLMTSDQSDMSGAVQIGEKTGVVARGDASGSVVGGGALGISVRPAKQFVRIDSTITNAPGGATGTSAVYVLGGADEQSVPGVGMYPPHGVEPNIKV